MTAIFLKILNMSIAAGWLVLAVILLRVVLKKAPKWIGCVLWGLVAVRLICPFSLESVLSLVPSAETVPQDILYAREPRIYSGISTLNAAVNPVIGEKLAPAVGDSVNPMQIITYVAAVLWIAGMLGIVLYAGVSYYRIRSKVAAAVAQEADVYICDYIETPFILGILRPRIYLPSVLEADRRDYVMAHERAHLARRDHWWKPLGFGLLTIYWFHPLMWVAYVLLCRDIELACDEKVVEILGEGDKKAYSDALLYCSVSRRRMLACPLAFGEVGVQERVRRVLNYKKPTFWMLAGALGICIVMAVCFLTNPKKDAKPMSVPFASTYYVEQVIYDAPQLSSCYTITSDSRYLFTEDNTMLDMVSGQWIERGNMTETKLTRDYFDRYFMETEGNAGWEDGYSAGKLRRNCQAAWELIVDDTQDGVQDGDLSFYLLQQKDGTVFLVCWYYDPERESDPFSDASFIRWVLKLTRADDEMPYRGDMHTVRAELPAYQGDDFLWGTYISEECRYMNPLSSTMSFGDSGKTYQFTEEAMIITDKSTGDSQSVVPNSWRWQEFPYTDEEWSDLFFPGRTERNINGQYEERLYLKLSARYHLCLMDGELWLINMAENPKVGKYIWSIYTLVTDESSISGEE